LWLRAAQVELNTIASSFACLSSITSQLHRYTLQRLAAASNSSSSSSDAAAALELLSASRLPSNAAMQGICRALAAAVVAAGDPGAVMVMVVQPGERNAYDQQVKSRSCIFCWCCCQTGVLLKFKSHIEVLLWQPTTSAL
jgi:glutathione synthase